MALRNAFEEITLESTLRALLRALNFARDPQDRLRIVIDQQPTVSLHMNNSSTSVQAGTTPTWFSSVAWNIMDAREEMREASAQTFQISRNRWTIT